MELTGSGLDGDLAAQAQCAPGLCLARVTAVDRGELDAAHYQSYLKLKAESAFNEMSYLGKRRKDKAFGKMVKSVLKEKRK